jgi:hypothetical protein
MVDAGVAIGIGSGTGSSDGVGDSVGVVRLLPIVAWMGKGTALSAPPFTDAIVRKLLSCRPRQRPPTTHASRKIKMTSMYLCNAGRVQNVYGQLACKREGLVEH